MKATRDRGARGNWLREVRTARYDSAEQAVSEFKRLTGHTIHRSAWASYESGGRPIGDQHMEWLEEFFGPFTEPSQSASNDDAVVKAIDRQTAMMEKLLDRLASLDDLSREFVALASKVAALEAEVRRNGVTVGDEQ